MNEELKKIFGESITVDGKSVPTAHLKYKGKERTYVVWTITAETPVLSADDEQLYSVFSVDVDVYSISNYLNVITEIKRIMKANGWLWVGDSAEMYEEETELYHKTISFEKERNIEWQE